MNRSLLLGLFLATLAALPAAPAPGISAPLRVGPWEPKSRATFAVAGEPAGARLHFVFRDGVRLHHAISSDEGATWTPPAFVAEGSGQVMAIDRAGTVHLVSESHASDRIEYRTFSRGIWSSAQDISATVPGGAAQLLAPRIAIDGTGNVHVIYWTLWKGDGWKDGSRCVYRYKPAGRAEFEPPVLWRDQAEKGYAKYGALAVDPAGDLHIFYAAGLFMRHGIERRVRHRDGTWTSQNCPPRRPRSPPSAQPPHAGISYGRKNKKRQSPAALAVNCRHFRAREAGR